MLLTFRSPSAATYLTPVQVVQESSSILCFPNETRLYLSNTTHSTMCKFSSQKDANYRKLRDRIAAEIRNQQKLKKINISPNGNTLEVEAQLKSIRGQVDKLQAGISSSVRNL
jgi:hypothetical protein